MNRLIKIFSKYYVLILFILLQTTSVVIIFQGRNYHRSLFVNAVNNVTGETYATVQGYRNYFSLKEQNEKLKAENEKLLQIAPASAQRLNAEYFQVDDSLYRQKYSYRKAQVVNSSTNRKDNYIVLDLGSKDGITEDMGVITGNGVLGMVVSVSDHYCKAISFLHQDTRVSCKIKRTGSTGILYWGNLEVNKAQFLDLPLTTKINKGDTIMTSGFSNVFPKGIELGVVNSFVKNQETQMLDIEVALFQDYRALGHAYIVEYLDKNEVESALQAPAEQ